MKKRIFVGICAALLLTSCAQEYNRVYKTTNNAYKYEFAKECFAKGKYGFAVPLLQDLVMVEKVRIMRKNASIAGYGGVWTERLSGCF